MKTPKQGFAVKQASTIDNYQNYENSVVNQDSIWEAL